MIRYWAAAYRHTSMQVANKSTVLPAAIAVSWDSGCLGYPCLPHTKRLLVLTLVMLLVGMCLVLQAEGYTFFRTIAPLVNMTNPAAAKEVTAIMTPGTPVTTGAASKVATALEPVFAKWNLTTDDIGTLGAQSPIGKCVNATSAAAPLAARFAPVAAAAAGAVFVALF